MGAWASLKSAFGIRPQERGFTDANDIPRPGASGLFGAVPVNRDSAMRASAVWACLRLRADLLSTMPVEVFRDVQGVEVQSPTPPVLVNPGGERVDILEWMYSTQVDLDRSGNAFGLITERDTYDLPRRVDLLDLGDVSVVPDDKDDAGIAYIVAGKRTPARDVWHEKQFTRSGLAVGLSPVAYAAYSIGGYLSAQQFALDWFGSNAIPAASLKNIERTVTPDQAAVIKERYKATVAGGDIFVHGRDWELNPIQAVGAQQQFIELMQYGIPDIARFFGAPADLIDAAVSGQSITYANLVQRNLQLLIMNLGPAIQRREAALSRLTPRPRRVRLNTKALLRMDPETLIKTLAVALTSRQMTPTEARGELGRAPFTPDDIAEIERVYGPPRPPTPVEAKT